MAETDRPIIIKRIKKAAAGHHGGSWKVAYADFVTALMAFFLLMWLLSSTSVSVREALSYYFTKFSVLESGSGVLPQPKAPDPKKQLNPAKPNDPKDKQDSARNQGSQGGNNGSDGKDAEENRQKAETAKKLQAAIDFKLSQYKDQIEITSTPEGVRVNIMDKAGQPMFLSGAAQFQGWSAQVLKTLAEELKQIPNPIAVEGHTDAVPFSGSNMVTNWELSTQRAIAARRALEYFGIPHERYARIIGYADKQLLYPDKPSDPRNRRISFIVQFSDAYKATPSQDSLPAHP